MIDKGNGEACSLSSRIVYVWQVPVRLVHWTNVLSIITLSVTGFYIGAPFMHAIDTTQNIMGNIRFVHFTAAYVFLVSVLARITWSFMGNKYSSWRTWFPFSRPHWGEFLNALQYYILIGGKKPTAVGHTALALITYFFLHILYGLMLLTGFAFYSMGRPESFVTVLMGRWVLNFVSPQDLRLYHHIIMYVILTFAAVHVYIAWWFDLVERNGTMSSMFSGNKFFHGENR